MRTGVVDGVELTVHVEHGDLLSSHLDQLAVVRFKLARLRYFDIFGHASLLDRSTFLRRAVLSGSVKTLDALSVPVVALTNKKSPRVSLFLAGWMQSTAHTSAQAVSLVPIQGSAIM